MPPFMSQSVTCNGFVFASRSLGLDPESDEFVAGSTYDRAVTVLESARTSLSKVIKVNIFLSKIYYITEVNKACAEFFVGDPKPARSCVAVAELPKGAEMEIELVAEA
ncbi:unnamed protein product [Clonostachys rosea f. rosea IK726]|uniref:Uncharacterized protein n=1 Tax=Clonostachys rosea f. rosea IK726 TaxID=1349383 RepID=A0ACA9TFI4_BIOOC|nr:unnamed protein product [Clonostachys rosea f. rosea IK726]